MLAEESTREMEGIARPALQGESAPAASAKREVRFEHSQHLGGLLSRLMGQLEFTSGVDEIFDVSAIPNARMGPAEVGGGWRKKSSEHQIPRLFFHDP